MFWGVNPRKSFEKFGHFSGDPNLPMGCPDIDFSLYEFSYFPFEIRNYLYHYFKQTT